MTSLRGTPVTLALADEGAAGGVIGAGAGHGAGLTVLPGQVGEGGGELVFDVAGDGDGPGVLLTGDDGLRGGGGTDGGDGGAEEVEDRVRRSENVLVEGELALDVGHLRDGLGLGHKDLYADAAGVVLALPGNRAGRRGGGLPALPAGWAG